jgi:hypothetical protein
MNDHSFERKFQALCNGVMIQYILSSGLEEKLMEDEPVVRDNMEGGEDGMRNNWDQGSWQRADIEGRTKETM